MPRKSQAPRQVRSACRGPKAAGPTQHAAGSGFTANEKNNKGTNVDSGREHASGSALDSLFATATERARRWLSDPDPPPLITMDMVTREQLAQCIATIERAVALGDADCIDEEVPPAIALSLLAPIGVDPHRPHTLVLSRLPRSHRWNELAQSVFDPTDLRPLMTHAVVPALISADPDSTGTWAIVASTSAHVATEGMAEAVRLFRACRTHVYHQDWADYHRAESVGSAAERDEACLACLRRHHPGDCDVGAVRPAQHADTHQLSDQAPNANCATHLPAEMSTVGDRNRPLFVTSRDDGGIDVMRGRDDVRSLRAFFIEPGTRLYVVLARLFELKQNIEFECRAHLVATRMFVPVCFKRLHSATIDMRIAAQSTLATRSTPTWQLPLPNRVSRPASRTAGGDGDEKGKCPTHHGQDDSPRSLGANGLPWYGLIDAIQQTELLSVGMSEHERLFLADTVLELASAIKVQTALVMLNERAPAAGSKSQASASRSLGKLAVAKDIEWNAMIVSADQSAGGAIATSSGPLARRPTARKREQALPPIDIIVTDPFPRTAQRLSLASQRNDTAFALDTFLALAIERTWDAVDVTDDTWRSADNGDATDGAGPGAGNAHGDGHKRLPRKPLVSLAVVRTGQNTAEDTPVLAPLSAFRVTVKRDNPTALDGSTPLGNNRDSSSSSDIRQKADDSEHKADKAGDGDDAAPCNAIIMVANMADIKAIVEELGERLKAAIGESEREFNAASLRSQRIKSREARLGSRGRVQALDHSQAEVLGAHLRLLRCKQKGTEFCLWRGSGVRFRILVRVARKLSPLRAFALAHAQELKQLMRSHAPSDDGSTATGLDRKESDSNNSNAAQSGVTSAIAAVVADEPATGGAHTDIFAPFVAPRIAHGRGARITHPDDDGSPTPHADRASLWPGEMIGKGLYAGRRRGCSGAWMSELHALTDQAHLDDIDAEFFRHLVRTRAYWDESSAPESSPPICRKEKTSQDEPSRGLLTDDSSTIHSASSADCHNNNNNNNKRGDGHCAFPLQEAPPDFAAGSTRPHDRLASWRILRRGVEYKHGRRRTTAAGALRGAATRRAPAGLPSTEDLHIKTFLPFTKGGFSAMPLDTFDASSLMPQFVAKTTEEESTPNPAGQPIDCSDAPSVMLDLADQSTHTAKEDAVKQLATLLEHDLAC